MILAIDFDGVIHDYKNPIEGRRMGPPITGALTKLTAWNDAGHTIIIHTVRGDQPKHIEDWMNFYGIPFHEITNIKPNADYYIDDKAIQFSDWGLIQI